MTLSERTDTETAEDQKGHCGPPPSCCGPGFAVPGPKGRMGCSPGSRGAGPDEAGERPGTAGSGPMGGMCGEMMKGGPRGLGPLLVAVALLLLGVGATVVLVPQAVTWLAAGVFGLAGLAMLAMGVRLCRVGTSRA